MTTQQALRARFRAWLMTALAAFVIQALSSGVSAAQTPIAAVPSLETANAVLFGKSSELTYTQAVEAVQRRAEQGNLFALRMNAAMWRTALPHPEHRTSHVATYLGARRLLAVAPGEAIRDLLPDPAEFAALGDEFGDLVYDERVDVMSDERSCTLLARPAQGVVFGLNNAGIFVHGSPAVSLEEYARFALRVDSNPAFVGTIPEPVATQRKALDAAARMAARGRLSMVEYERKVNEFSTMLPPTAPVYVVGAGDAQFETLLRQLAVGDTVRARVVLPDGSERVASWSLTVTDKRLPKAMNYFDLVGYRYVNCLFSGVR